MIFPHGETVTVLSPTVTVDGYGDTQWTWDAPTSVTVTGCGIADGGSIEPVPDARSAVVSDFDVICPPGTAITPHDRVVVPRNGGLVCDVMGRPFDWLNPFTGWQPGIVIRCKVVEG